MNIPSNLVKQAVWDAFYSGRPTRTPLRWNINVRVCLLNPQHNPEGWSFEDYLHDPEVTIGAQAHFQALAPRFYGQCSDLRTELPEHWRCRADVQNCYDAAFFGGKIYAPPGQVPAVEPFLTLDDVDDFLATDFCADIANNPFIKERLAFTEELKRVAKDFRFEGRSTKVNDYVIFWSDGPLTAGLAIFGADFFTLLGLDPAKGEQVIAKITRDTLQRNRWLLRRAGLPERAPAGGFADDATQLISSEMYRQIALKWHRYWCDETDEAAGKPLARSCHMCGDATRHFKMIRDEIGVGNFDTGFPVDHGWLRRELGPEVIISGGPHIELLLNGTPDACYREAQRILQSGIRDGGKFILQEGNNLPPRVPLANLSAVYQACLDCGNFT